MMVRALLAEARRRAGLSQRQLAVASGIPQASVSRIEAGRIAPRAGTVESWLAACGLSLELAPLPGTGIDRSAIRERLAMTPTQRSRVGTQEARAMVAMARGRLHRTAK